MKPDNNNLEAQNPRRNTCTPRVSAGLVITNTDILWVRKVHIELMTLVGTLIILFRITEEVSEEWRWTKSFHLTGFDSVHLLTLIMTACAVHYCHIRCTQIIQEKLVFKENYPLRSRLKVSLVGMPYIPSL